MFDEELLGRWNAEQRCAGGRQQRCHLGNFEAEGSGWRRLTVRHEVSYGTFLTASEQSRSLCVFGSGRHMGPG